MIEDRPVDETSNMASQELHCTRLTLKNTRNPLHSSDKTAPTFSKNGIEYNGNGIRAIRILLCSTYSNTFVFDLFEYFYCILLLCMHPLGECINNTAIWVHVRRDPLYPNGPYYSLYHTCIRICVRTICNRITFTFNALVPDVWYINSPVKEKVEPPQWRLNSCYTTTPLYATPL